MGYHVQFFGFQKRPDIDALKAIDWLDDWSLLSLEAGKVFLLVTVQGDAEFVDFFPVNLQIEESGKPETDITNEIKKSITDGGGRTDAFDYENLMICQNLSQCLKTKVIYAQGDDEGNDLAFICSNGEIERAKCQVEWDRAVFFKDSGWHIEQQQPDDVDPNTAAPRNLHEIAKDEAERFFQRELDWLGDFDGEIALDKAQILASKGTPFVPKLKLNDQLSAQYGGRPNLSSLLKIYKPYVAKALSNSLPAADNEVRFAMDEEIGSLARYIEDTFNQDWSESKSSFLSRKLAKFLWSVQNYCKALRPKPEFRRSDYNFTAVRRRLLREWKTIELLAHLYR